MRSCCGKGPNGSDREASRRSQTAKYALDALLPCSHDRKCLRLPVRRALFARGKVLADSVSSGTAKQVQQKVHSTVLA